MSITRLDSKTSSFCLPRQHSHLCFGQTLVQNGRRDGGGLFFNDPACSFRCNIAGSKPRTSSCEDSIQFSNICPFFQSPLHHDRSSFSLLGNIFLKGWWPWYFVLYKSFGSSAKNSYCKEFNCQKSDSNLKCSAQERLAYTCWAKNFFYL